MQLVGQSYAGIVFVFHINRQLLATILLCFSDLFLTEDDLMADHLLTEKI
jgi:hypothetical protein